MRNSTNVFRKIDLMALISDVQEATHIIRRALQSKEAAELAAISRRIVTHLQPVVEVIRRSVKKG
jgi:hypothetical protein